LTLREDGGQRLGLSAFGLSLLTDLAPPGAWQAGPRTGPFLRLRAATAGEIAESWSGLEEVGWEGTIDDTPFVAQRGAAGDHRFLHGAAVHHLSPDLGLLLCAHPDPADPSWWRVVLDSVLFTVALLHGYEALHAGALATPEGAIAITASTGGGKSTLISELLARGLTLMTDDVIVLAHAPSGSNGLPLAYAGPPLMTIPAARLPPLEQTCSAEAIATIGDERWIAMPVHPEPLRLRALVVLNRTPGLATDLHPIGRPLPVLLDSLLRFPRTPTRERTRFEMAASIAASIPIWRLDADPAVTPSVLADRLLSELATPPPQQAVCPPSSV
jgi:hypothetical protein